ncbi:hypothetical protein [Pseudoalteromonas sp. 20-MNA-CIBAN-0454]|mgnify:CR=1 FL=1|uniref:hypothetical protein n=1 Tax=Pseudoalteromonas sp. 20-MNA-CIBAN-0454 TaxID=3140424 RepID=UPI003319B990
MRIIPLILATLFLLGCDEKPETYDECILENMKGVKSDVGAKLIHRSCYEKNKKQTTPKEIKQLGVKERLNLTGRASLGYSNYYSGNIYNGNESITVTELKIKITTTNGKSKTSRYYIDEVNIPPLTSKSFGVDIILGGSGSEYSWVISSAKGYEVKQP